MPDEPGEAIRYDGTNADAIVTFCGPGHTEIIDGVVHVWERYHERVDGNLEQRHDRTELEVGDVVVNPYRGNFLVYSAAAFANDWEVTDG